MRINWILTSLISGLIGGVITYFLTGNWQMSLISTIIIFVIVILNNPERRYLRAFYIVLFPLLSNVYFTIQSKTENFDIKAGLKELDSVTTAVLGIIAVTCLILDYLTRSGKWKGNLINIFKNTTRNVSGENIHINQEINNKDATNND